MCEVGGENGVSCGIGGTCIDGICVCRDNWLQSDEFLFISDDELAQFSDPRPCDLNLPLIQSLYGILLVSTIFGLIYYGISIKKRSQAKRLLPAFFVAVNFFTICVMKLAKPEFAVGHDVGITLLVGISIFLLNLSLQVFLNKFIRYQYRTLKIRNQRSLAYIKFIAKIGYFMIFLTFVMIILFLAVPIVNKNFSKEAQDAEIIIRTAFGIAFTAALYQVVSEFILIGLLLRDIRDLALGATWIQKKAVNATRYVEVVSVTTNSVNGLLFLLAAVSVDGLRGWKYALPLVFWIYALASILVLGVNRWTRKLKTTSTARRHGNDATSRSRFTQTPLSGSGIANMAAPKLNVSVSENSPKPKLTNFSSERLNDNLLESTQLMNSL